MNSSGVEILNELYGKLDESIFGPEYFMSYYIEGMYHRFSSLCDKFLKTIDNALLKANASAHRCIITDNFNRGYIRNLDATERDDVSIRLVRERKYHSIGQGLRFVSLCREKSPFCNCIQLQETAHNLSVAYGTEITISPTDVMEFLPGDTVIEVEAVGNYGICCTYYFIYTETYDSYRNCERKTKSIKFDSELIAKQLEAIRFFEQVHQEKKNFHKLPPLLPNGDDW